MNIYNELFTILSDALYGADAVLNNYQEFVLTQISTYLSYALILLPLVVVVTFTIRLLRY